MRLFRHRTAHKARRRTRLTTSCRGGCRGLAELGFESLGARGGSQLPAHASETGPKRPATRRGGTRPTGVQYFSDRKKSVHDFPAHTLLSDLPLCAVGPRARRDGAFCCFMCESGHRNSTSTSFGSRLLTKGCVLLLQDLLLSCSRGGGGEWRTCAMRDDEPWPVWTSLPITH